MSLFVQVFERRHDERFHALWRPASKNLHITGPEARAIASMATSTPGMSAPNLTIVRAGFAPGKNSTYASFISL
jgi:hypothetical protein